MRSTESVSHTSERRFGSMFRLVRERDISSKTSSAIRLSASFSSSCSTRTLRAYRVKRCQSSTPGVLEKCYNMGRVSQAMEKCRRLCVLTQCSMTVPIFVSLNFFRRGARREKRLFGVLTSRQRIFSTISDHFLHTVRLFLFEVSSR